MSWMKKGKGGESLRLCKSNLGTSQIPVQVKLQCKSNLSARFCWCSQTLAKKRRGKELPALEMKQLGDAECDSGPPSRPNQVEFAAPSGISGDGEESMVNCPQKIGNQCGSVVKSTWSKVWLGRHDDEYKRSKSGKTRGGKKL